MDIKVEPRDYHVDAVQGKLVRKVRDYSSIKAGEEEQYVQLLLLWQRVIEDLFLSWNVPMGLLLTF